MIIVYSVIYVVCAIACMKTVLFTHSIACAFSLLIFTKRFQSRLLSIRHTYPDDRLFLFPFQTCLTLPNNGRTVITIYSLRLLPNKKKKTNRNKAQRNETTNKSPPYITMTNPSLDVPFKTLKPRRPFLKRP